MQKITPCLWFDHQAEEAANYYISIFKKDSRITQITRYSEAGPGEPGSVMNDHRSRPAQGAARRRHVADDQTGRCPRPPRL